MKRGGISSVTAWETTIHTLRDQHERALGNGGIGKALVNRSGGRGRHQQTQRKDDCTSFPCMGK